MRMLTSNTVKALGTISGAHVGIQQYTQNRAVRILAVHISSFGRIVGLETCLESIHFVHMFHGLSLSLVKGTTDFEILMQTS